MNLFDINVKLELDNSGPVNLRKSLLFLANVKGKVMPVSFLYDSDVYGEDEFIVHIYRISKYVSQIDVEYEDVNIELIVPDSDFKHFLMAFDYISALEDLMSCYSDAEMMSLLRRADYDSSLPLYDAVLKYLK